MTSLVTLRSVRADWLRVQSEVAWVGMLLAGQRYFGALSREQKFNPNHDALGRFATGDGADAQGSFLSLEAANDFTNRILQKNQTRVDAVASGATDEAWLPERFGYPTGKEAFHASADEPVYIRPTYYVGVLIRHDATSPRGYRVHTAYPLNKRPD